MSSSEKSLREYLERAQSTTTITVDQYLEALSLRASGHVKRWHVHQIHGQQTVAEHSGQAVSLLMMLHPDPSVALIKAMMWHDASERIVGDMPSPGKRAHPELMLAYENAEIRVCESLHPTAHAAISSLSHDDLCWLRACDVLELYLFCCDQEMLGNKHSTIVKTRAQKWLLDDQSVPALVKEFVHMQIVDGNRSHA